MPELVKLLVLFALGLAIGFNGRDAWKHQDPGATIVALVCTSAVIAIWVT